MPDIPRATVVADLIDASHEEDEDELRQHLGCSLIGQKCERRIWLTFRFAVIEKKSGRVRRLLRRGQREEFVIKDDLERIGLRVINEQEKVDFGCHVAGSIDGEVENVPQAPKTRHLLEDKTHKLSSFNDLSKHGVEKSKPEHYAQMQMYMLGRGLTRALYIAVCKDDDRLHDERVKLDKKYAEWLVERGHRIALDERMPPGISDDPTWWECKMCPCHTFCHKEKLTHHANCRTCALVTPTKDGVFHCSRWDDSVPFEHQQKGCKSHVLHQDLVPWEYESIGERRHCAYGPFINGNPDELDAAISSVELIDNELRRYDRAKSANNATSGDPEPS